MGDLHFSSVNVAAKKTPSKGGLAHEKENEMQCLLLPDTQLLECVKSVMHRCQLSVGGMEF